jgi:hypothetical protein
MKTFILAALLAVTAVSATVVLSEQVTAGGRVVSNGGSNGR